MSVCVKLCSHTSSLESAMLIGGLVSNFIVRPQLLSRDKKVRHKLKKLATK
jgi:hypothetical protein